MAAYKDLIGQKITKVTSNPSDQKQDRCGTTPLMVSLEV